MKYREGTGKVVTLDETDVRIDLPRLENQPLWIRIFVDNKDLDLLSRELNIPVEGTYYGARSIQIRKKDLWLYFVVGKI